MVDLGRKDRFNSMPVSPTKEKNRIYYPSFHVDNIDLGVDEEDVGKTITATVKLKVNSAGKRINDREGTVKKTEDYSFDVLAIDLGKPQKKRDGRENKLQADTEEALEEAATKKKD